MNMRLFTVTLAAFTAYALGACKVETSDSTSTGTAESTTTSTGATTTGGGGAGGAGTGVGGTGGAATGVGGNGGAGGEAACDPAYTCADAVAPSSGNPAKLCEGDAKKLYTALSTCTCTGACATDCKDSACMGNDPSTTCKICLANSSTGCGKELNACTDAG